LGDGNFFQQPAPKSFGGLTRRNFSRTSSGGVITVAQASGLCFEFTDRMSVPPWKTVLTI
jgi:hypothetical protein